MSKRDYFLIVGGALLGASLLTAFLANKNSEGENQKTGYKASVGLGIAGIGVIIMTLKK